MNQLADGLWCWTAPHPEASTEACAGGCSALVTHGEPVMERAHAALEDALAGEP